MKKLIIQLVFILCMVARSNAQDPVFSQAFLSPINLNPAAAGTGRYDFRVSGVYRRQWWSIPSGMNYMAFSADKFLPAISSGVGVLATHSSEGYLVKNGFYGIYSYNICSGSDNAADPPKWFFNGGLQFGLAQRKIDYRNLVFADQLNTDGYIPGSVTQADVPRNSGKLFPDFAAGIFFNYNFSAENRLLIGLANHHLNQPDETLTYTGDSIRSVLPMLWTGNLLYTHTNTAQTWSYSIGGVYYRQANNNSFQVGAEVTQNKVDVSLGMWYRGSTNFQGVNTFSVTLSINLVGTTGRNQAFRVGVAHDAEVGRKAYSYSAGSSELGFVWDKSTYDQPDDDPCKPNVNSYMCPAPRR
ncbi:MAG TPA: PorP/SprF family type IX secretion system membrane protein [Chitinophagaceae bacterium]|nr:PorP/SprF family type IX secretion system membrane protein [Chitinophagaceae bacterium]